MLPKAKTVYFHVDVNSAFLSWTAIQHLANGETLDLRTVPAVVGGDEEKRHGVVLAKSIPAKRYGIKTGESLFMARSKYPNLIVAAPDFDWYVKNSKAMIRIFGDYTPDIEQYSIDEAFLNMTGSEGLFGPPLQAAQTIKDRIHRELGFTVNIGIAPNRLLAKMASDFEKPDKIHVLTQDMVPQKLWPLPVGNLFGVDGVLVGNIADIAMGSDASLFVSGQTFINQFLLDIIENDGSAAVCHSGGDSKTDAVRSTGDQGNLAGQIKRFRGADRHISYLLKVMLCNSKAAHRAAGERDWK